MTTPLTAEEIAELRKRANDEGSGASVDATLRLLDEVERTRALLRRVEWSGNIGQGGLGCAACESEERRGHRPDCELAALLGEGGAPGNERPPGAKVSAVYPAGMLEFMDAKCPTPQAHGNADGCEARDCAPCFAAFVRAATSAAVGPR